MTRGYVLVYDERKDIVGGNALLQKKVYSCDYTYCGSPL